MSLRRLYVYKKKGRKTDSVNLILFMTWISNAILIWASKITLSQYEITVFNYRHVVIVDFGQRFLISGETPCRHELCSAFINFPRICKRRPGQRWHLFPGVSTQFRGTEGSGWSPCFPDISYIAEKRLRIRALFRARAFKLITDGRIYISLPIESPPRAILARETGTRG